MKMPLFKVTVKDSRKGVIIYSTILLLYAMLIVMMYPIISDEYSDPLTQGDGILLEEKGAGDSGEMGYNLSWDPRVGSSYHLAIGAEDAMTYGYFTSFMEGNETDLELDDLYALIDNSSLLSTYGLELMYVGSGTYVEFERANETSFFWVIFLTSDTNLTPISISDAVSTMDLAKTSSFDDYMEDNPMMEGFFGDNVVDFSTLEGFVTLEFFSMWLLFLVIFLCIKAGGSVAKHIEDKSMDILLATGYSRERFLMEKLLAQMVFMVFVSLGAFLGVVLGTIFIGEPVLLGSYAITFLGSIPLALTFIGLAMLVSVLVDEGARVTALMMGLVVGQYAVMIIANLSNWGDWMKYLSLFSYFNSSELMMDRYLDPINVIVPLVLFGVFTAVAFFLFRRKEIHA